MYYYVNILLTKNALNTFISNENNFVQNQLLRSADSISFSFIPVAYSALLCWSPASIDFNGAALNSFFQCLETRRSLDNAAIMSRPRTLSVSGIRACERSGAWSERGAERAKYSRSAERVFIQRLERSLCLAPVPLRYRSHHEPRACTNPPWIHLCLQQLTKPSAYTLKIVRCEGVF